MNKLAVYLILLLIYLGLSKSFSPTNFGLSNINNNNDFAEIIPNYPVSIILTDIQARGFIIKSYYHKYRVVYGYQSVEDLIVKANKRFSITQHQFLGLSIFRRLDKDSPPETTPLPPGSLFIGNSSFGHWKLSNDGERRWQFYKVYRNLPKLLGWGEFLPKKTFYDKLILAQEDGIKFYGLENEFGPNGYITQAAFPMYFDKNRQQNFNLKSKFTLYFKQNFLSKTRTPNE